ncbi:MAG: glycosyl transferase [Cyanobacteriota bacterium]|nr:glycosyl transferase [Cyanobacteriota bacterium]
MNISVKQFAKSLNLGVIAYRLYYAPKGLIQHYIRRDPMRRAIDEQARQQMEAATYHLKPIKNDPTAENYEIYFLSGKRFWYQTCFCAYSMALHSNINLRPVVYDDGTLENKYVEQIKRIFPDAKIIYLKDIEERLDEYLPVSKFPSLRERRANYPNMRKLTDIHIASSGWKLVLDSDMIFFRTPTFLINWLKSPSKPCHMVDVETSYGYSDALMTSLTGAEITERLNVGICGLNSDEIDWEQLEFWCRTLIEKEGTHYYQEQALIAMLMAGQTCEVAPEKDYIVMPDKEEVVKPKAILHHYVADSKPWYFRYAWHHVFNSTLNND